ncbi:hypothetical protein [Brevibacillus sp. 179-C8.1 HS]
MRLPDTPLPANYNKQWVEEYQTGLPIAVFSGHACFSNRSSIDVMVHIIGEEETNGKSREASNLPS